MKDPSMEQTAAGLANLNGISDNLDFTKNEADLLRNLAKQVAELSTRLVEEEKKKAWTALNDLQCKRPLIFCDPENGWNEIIPQEQIKCTNPLARVWEMALRKEIFWGAKMKDDRVIEPFFNVPYHYTDTGYGVAYEQIGGEDGGSFVYNYPVKNYEEDFGRLEYPQLVIDHQKTSKVVELAKEIFDGILTIRLRGIWWWTLGMTWEFMKLRGLENLMIDMMMNPDWVHKLMDFLCTAFHKRLDFLEENKMLSLNTEGSYVGSGGFGWTTQLPQPGFDPGHVRLKDMWGFAESQETVGVSPEMFNEFIFPYQIGILERFGLNCYGCCEPIDPRWEYIKTIPRLRRVSASPWADIQKMTEYLDNKYVLSLKLSPSLLAVSQMNEEAVRKELTVKLEQSKGGCVEVIMKDNHTLGNNPHNAVRWCEIAREEINKIY